MVFKKFARRSEFFRVLRFLCIVQCLSVGVVWRWHGVPLYAVFAVHFRRLWFIGVLVGFRLV